MMWSSHTLTLRIQEEKRRIEERRKKKEDDGTHDDETANHRRKDNQGNSLSPSRTFQRVCEQLLPLHPW